MKTLCSSHPQESVILENAENQRRLEALCQLIELGQGAFALALVEFDLPSQQRVVLQELQRCLRNLHMVTVDLTPPPIDTPRTHVLDQLRERVHSTCPDHPPDALIITGLEALLSDAHGAFEGHLSAQDVRVLQPLNLGRNVFAETFPCPVLLCLPPAAMALLLRSAPDLVSWKSGFFQFQSPVEDVRAAISQLARVRTPWWQRWRWRYQTTTAWSTQATFLEDFITDAEALSMEGHIVARLYDQLGWVYVALKYRPQARAAFAAMLQLARQAEDHRLVSLAERGQQAAERLSPSPLLASKRLTPINAADIYGREAELEHLVARVTSPSPNTRFLIVWGERGCGKTSLVLSGLVPRLQRLGAYMPVVVSQWGTPETSLCRALERAVQLPHVVQPTLLSCLQQAAQRSEKRVVIVCDQFEQFFDLHVQRSARQPFLQVLGTCINDIRLKCKFVFVVRGDALWRMVDLEFDSNVREPLEQNKRFYVPLLSTDDAARALHRIEADWPEVFVRQIVSDLTHDGRVRPVDLHMVSTALVAAGITERNYARSGGARGLREDYLPLVLARMDLTKREMQQLKRVLLALVAEPSGRLTLTSESIAQGIGYPHASVRGMLKSLTEADLVREISCVGQASGASVVRYELTHDVLVDLVLIFARDLQDKRRKAARVLRRALEDITGNPRHTIGLRDWWIVRQHSDETILREPKVAALLPRSLRWGLCKWLGLYPAASVLMSLLVLQICRHSSGYVSLEKNFSDRVVVRRRLPTLNFLPGLGDSVVLDTGFTAAELKDEKRSQVQGLVHWEWGNQQSSVLRRQEFVDALNPSVTEGILLYSRGQDNSSPYALHRALQHRDESRRKAVAQGLGQVVQVVPFLAEHLLEPLKLALRDRDAGVRWVAVETVGRVMRVAPLLAESLVEPLRNALEDEETEVRRVVAEMLEQVLQRQPSLTERTYALLVQALRDSNQEVRRAAVRTVGQVVPVAPLLVERTYEPLVQALQDGHAEVRWVVAEVLGQVVQVAPLLADRTYTLLVQARQQDGDKEVRRAATRAVGQAVRVAPSLAERAFESLSQTLQDHNEDEGVRRAAIRAIGQAVRVAPSLAERTLEFVSQALQDRDGGVRLDAVEVVEQVIQVVPSLVDRAFTLLMQALQDSEEQVRQQAAKAIGQVIEYRPSLAERTFVFLSQRLGDRDEEIRRTAVRAVGQLIQHPLADRTFELLMRALQDRDGRVRWTAAESLGQVVQVVPSLAVRTLAGLESALQDRNVDVRRAATESLGQVLHVAPTLAEKVFDLLKLALQDRNVDMRKTAAELAGQSVNVAPSLADRTCAILLQALQDTDVEVRQATLRAIGQVIQVVPILADRMLDPLMELALQANDDRLSWEAARVVWQIVQGTPSLADRIVDFLRPALKDDNPEIRRMVARTVGYTLQVAPTMRALAFTLLLAHDRDIREEMQVTLTDFLVHLASAEAKQGRDAVQFLLAHLDGRRSLLPNGGNANTYAVYRHVVVGALAQWLVSETTEAKQSQQALGKQLVRIWEQDQRLHLRIAAWRVFVQAAALWEERQRRQ